MSTPRIAATVAFTVFVVACHSPPQVGDERPQSPQTKAVPLRSTAPIIAATQAKRQDRPSSDVASKPLLRYDGLYQSRLPYMVAGGSASDYIRFYSDGYVAEATSNGEPADVQGWMVRDGRNVSHGTLVIDGKSIRFAAIDSYGTVEYSGAVNGDSLSLTLDSKVTGQKTDREFHFVPFH